MDFWSCDGDLATWQSQTVRFVCDRDANSRYVFKEDGIMVHGYIIILKRTGEDGSKYPLTEPELKIGTSAECSLRINTAGVASEQCALLVADDGKVKVKNLCKATPTIINSRPLIGEAKLKHQDILTIGGRWLRFEYPSTATGRSGSKKKAVATPKLGKTPVGTPKVKSTNVRRSLASALNSTVPNVQKLTASAKVQKTSKSPALAKDLKKRTPVPGDGRSVSRIPKLGTMPGRRSLKATKLIFSASKRKASELSNDLTKGVKSPKAMASKKSSPLNKRKSPVKRTDTPMKLTGNTPGSMKTPGLKTIAESSPNKGASTRKTPGKSLKRKLLSPGFAVQSALKNSKKVTTPTSRTSLKGSVSKKSPKSLTKSAARIKTPSSARKSVGGSRKTPKSAKGLSPAKNSVGKSILGRGKTPKRLSKVSNLSASPLLMDFSTPETARRSIAKKLLRKTPTAGRSTSSPSPAKYATPGTSKQKTPRRMSKIADESLTTPLMMFVTPETVSHLAEEKLSMGKTSSSGRKSLKRWESQNTPTGSPTVLLSRMSVSSSESSSPGKYKTPSGKKSPRTSYGSPIEIGSDIDASLLTLFKTPMKALKSAGKKRKSSVASTPSKRIKMASTSTGKYGRPSSSKASPKSRASFLASKLTPKSASPKAGRPLKSLGATRKSLKTPVRVSSAKQSPGSSPKASTGTLLQDSFVTPPLVHKVIRKSPKMRMSSSPKSPAKRTPKSDKKSPLKTPKPSVGTSALVISPSVQVLVRQTPKIRASSSPKGSAGRSPKSAKKSPLKSPKALATPSSIRKLISETPKIRASSSPKTSAGRSPKSPKTSPKSAKKSPLKSPKALATPPSIRKLISETPKIRASSSPKTSAGRSPKSPKTSPKSAKKSPLKSPKALATPPSIRKLIGQTPKIRASSSPKATAGRSPKSAKTSPLRSPKVRTPTLVTPQSVQKLVRQTPKIRASSSPQSPAGLAPKLLEKSPKSVRKSPASSSGRKSAVKPKGSTPLKKSPLKSPSTAKAGSASGGRVSRDLSLKLSDKPDKNKKKALLVLGKAGKVKGSAGLKLKAKIIKKAIQVATKAKKRGRPAKVDSLLSTPSPVKRGRPSKTDFPSTETPGSTKRGRASKGSSPSKVTESPGESRGSPSKKGSPSKVAKSPGVKGTPGSGKRGRSSDTPASVVRSTPSQTSGSPKRGRTPAERSPAQTETGRASRVTSPLKAMPSPVKRGKSPIKVQSPGRASPAKGDSPTKKSPQTLPSITYSPATSSSVSSSGSDGKPRRVFDLSSIPLPPLPPKGFSRRSSKRISSKTDVVRPDYTELSPTALGLTPRNVEPFRTPKMKGRHSTSLVTPRNKGSPSIMKAASTTKKTLRKNVSFSKGTKSFSDNSTVGDFSLAHDISQDVFVSSLDSISSRGSGDSFSSFNSTPGAQNWLHTISSSPDLSAINFESLGDSPNSVAFRNRIKQNLFNYLSPKKGTGSPGLSAPLLCLNELAVQDFVGSRDSARKMSPRSDEDSTSQNNVIFISKKRQSNSTTPRSSTSTPKRLSRTPGSANDLTDVSGGSGKKVLSSSRLSRCIWNLQSSNPVDLESVDRLIGQQEYDWPSTFVAPAAVEGPSVRTLVRVPVQQKSPKNRLSDLGGVKRLLGTPRPKERNPQNRLSDLRGVKRLLGTPRPKERNPKNRLSDLRGVKHLLGSPVRKQNSPKNDLSDLRGVKQLLGSPKPKQKSPLNRLSNLRGVKRLISTPKPVKSPKNRLSDLRGVKQLLGSPMPPQKSPKNSLEDVAGVKRLFESPKVSSKSRLTDFRGVRELMKTPKSPKNRLSDLRGVKKLLGAGQKSPKNDLSNVSGLSELFDMKPASRVVESKKATSRKPKGGSTAKKTTRGATRAKSSASPSKKIKAPPSSRSRTRAARVASPAIERSRPALSLSPEPVTRKAPVKGASAAAKRGLKPVVVSPTKSAKIVKATAGDVTSKSAVSSPRKRRGAAKAAAPTRSPVRVMKPARGKRKVAFSSEAAVVTPPKRGRKAASPRAKSVASVRGRKGKSSETEDNVVTSTVTPVEEVKKERSRPTKKTRARRVVSSSASSTSGSYDGLTKKPRTKVVKATPKKKTPSPSPRKTRQKVKAAAPTKAPSSPATSPKKTKGTRKPAAATGRSRSTRAASKK